MNDPQMEFNPATGKHRMVLVNGDLVPTDAPDYEILTMLTEDPGWFMEETPRRGSLVREFEITTRLTPSQMKASLEDRCDPLKPDVLTDAECVSVTQPADGQLAFQLRYTQPGKPPAEPVSLEVGI